MKTIYLDQNFRCYIFLDNPYMTIETSYFDDKCQTYIEGYRFVPANYTWIRPDGSVFVGEMISPAVEYSILEAAQKQYEENLALMSDMQNALDILGVES